VLFTNVIPAFIDNIDLMTQLILDRSDHWSELSQES